MNSISVGEVTSAEIEQCNRSRGGVMAAALSVDCRATSVREMVTVARDTVVVLLIQIAFRAMLLLRRWNY